MAETPITIDSEALKKAPTGIKGLDEITDGGLPKGRPTLIAGAAGSGKTLLAMEFLVHGAIDYNEPGVFMAFKRRPGTGEELKSLGFDLKKLSDEKRISLDYVYVERSEIEETGGSHLDGLFVWLGYAIDSIGAKRVVLDTIEVLFASLPNEAILRAELRRLFRWLKDKGVTTIITGERGTDMLTRHGLEEYVADCVILLDHRVAGRISTQAPPGRQIPRLLPRHERVPLLDRRSGHQRAAGHVFRVEASRVEGAGTYRHTPARYHVRR